MTIIQFTPFSSLVEPNFWHALTNLKIDVLRLSDESVPITGYYSPGRSIVDRETGNEIPLGCNINIPGDALTNDIQYVFHSHIASLYRNSHHQGSCTLRACFWTLQELQHYRGVQRGGQDSVVQQFITRGISCPIVPLWSSHLSSSGIDLG